MVKNAFLFATLNYKIMDVTVPAGESAVLELTYRKSYTYKLLFLENTDDGFENAVCRVFLKMNETAIIKDNNMGLDIGKGYNYAYLSPEREGYFVEIRDKIPSITY